jgi:hypothetical protein
MPSESKVRLIPIAGLLCGHSLLGPQTRWEGAIRTLCDNQTFGYAKIALTCKKFDICRAPPFTGA